MLFFQTFLRNTHAFDYSEEKNSAFPESLLIPGKKRFSKPFLHQSLSAMASRNENLVKLHCHSVTKILSNCAVIRKPAGWSDSNQNHGYYCEMRNSIRRDFRPFYPERKLKSLRWSTTIPTFLIMPFQQQYAVHEMKPWPIKLTGEKESGLNILATAGW